VKEFYYKGKQLYCEKVRVSDIVKKTGTPLYVYSTQALTGNFKKLESAFRPIDPLICYSVKANSNLAVIKTLVAQGAGLDIVSGGELFRAKRAGCDPKKIVFAGVGKTEEEIAEALRAGILLFNAESFPEFERIHAVAKKTGKRARISLRINPDIDPRTHEHIATGKAKSKFGIDFVTAMGMFLNRRHYPAVSLCGLHVHIGSQIVSAEPFVQAYQKILSFAEELRQRGVEIEFLNLGGGWGVAYHQENIPPIAESAKKIVSIFRRKKYKFMMEPGRFISAESGILVGRVTYVKQTSLKNFAICDMAMNDLIRPTLYKAHHEILPLEKREGAEPLIYDVVGPVCESGDFLAKGRILPKLASGDLLAVMTSGAYGFVMASNYNSRPRGAEVLVKGNRWAIVRTRESRQDLIRGEMIPKFCGK